MEEGLRHDWSGVAVIVPCLDEAPTVGKVVRDFRHALPGCTVYVYDNGSTDGTAALAACAGAVVRRAPIRGKGNAVRQALMEVDADCYLLVDGDDTYEAADAPRLAGPVLAHAADHVVGDRISSGDYARENARVFHGLGNDLVRGLIKWLYGFSYADVMTGYRALSRPFAKTLALTSGGFEMETELSIEAVDKGWRTLSVPIGYRDRHEGSVSKLDTIPDGVRVLRTIATLFRDYRPLPFFGTLAAVLLALCLALGVPVVAEYMATGLVPRLPTAVLAAALGMLSAMMASVGLVLDTVAKDHKRTRMVLASMEAERGRGRA